jgi:hypothetical protein
MNRLMLPLAGSFLSISLLQGWVTLKISCARKTSSRRYKISYKSLNKTFSNQHQQLSFAVASDRCSTIIKCIFITNLLQSCILFPCPLFSRACLHSFLQHTQASALHLTPMSLSIGVSSFPELICAFTDFRLGQNSYGQGTGSLAQQRLSYYCASK